MSQRPALRRGSSREPARVRDTDVDVILTLRSARAEPDGAVDRGADAPTEAPTDDAKGA
ncbi:hypothetical protein GCM10010129_33640 [Streptomyces fumigatiscleroticus]|nr:hypothetical protein GCM10010129_33640 [Streptomyces fumigatiscleroticus]